ncbi:hypothetical protein DMENIID0001_014870 [Sergentomyia squamirostris]
MCESSASVIESSVKIIKSSSVQHSSATSVQQSSGGLAYVTNKPRLTTETIRCYNCSMRGHRSAECPKKKRPVRTCYECASAEHTFRRCPLQKRVAAVTSAHPITSSSEDHRDLNLVNVEQTLSAIQMVSVAIDIPGSGRTKSIICQSLLDTGSPVSFINISSIPKDFPVGELKYANYWSLGSTRLYTYGEIDCNLHMAGKLRKVKLLIVPNDALPIPLLLGRDILKQFNVHLSLYGQDESPQETMNCDIMKSSYFLTLCAYKPSSILRTPECYDTISPQKVQSGSKSQDGSEILSYGAEISLKSSVSKVVSSGNKVDQCRSSDDSISVPLNDVFSIDIDCMPENEWFVNPGIGLQWIKKFQEVIKDDYIDNDVTPNPLNVEMKIRLKSDVPFYCNPRRLSYQEKSEVREMVKEYMDETKIRPSNSAYASPIVLVRKKNTNKRRFCIDFRVLNSLTIRDNYPIPRIDDCLEYLTNKKYCRIPTLGSLGCTSILQDDTK